MALIPYEESQVLTEMSRDGAVAHITLNRPETLNAMTVNIYRRLAELVDQFEKDEAVKVIVFRGAEGVFSSGQDVNEAYDFYFRDDDDPKSRPSMRRRLLVNDGGLWGKRGMTESIFYSLKPTLAIVEYRCFGAGLDIVMACDMAVADSECVFGHPGFTYHGFGGDLASYIHHLGPKRAKEFTLTSRPFEATEAAELGLINRAVPMDELDGAADQIIDDIAKMPADALVMQKAYYRTVLDAMGFATNYSAALQTLAFASNIKYDRGDNVMVRDKSEAGASAAIKRRKEHYGHM